MKTHSFLTSLLTATLLAAPASGTVTFYLSQTPLGPATPPTGVNPSITLNSLGESVTLYLWAQTAAGTCSALGLNYVETNGPIVTAPDVTVWNGIINPNDDPMNPEIPLYDWAIFRWNAYSVTTGDLAGIKCVGGFDDQGVQIAGFTTTKRTAGDPTWRGSSPYQWYLGSVTFTATAVGETDIFLTVNDLLLLANATLIGTPASPAIRFGWGEPSPAPVSFEYATYYVADGVTNALPDAHITVIPEPATLGLLAVGGLALLRRRS